MGEKECGYIIPAILGFHIGTKWLHYPRWIGGTRNGGAIRNGFMAFAISKALDARSNQTWPHNVGPLGRELKDQDWVEEQEDLSNLEEPFVVVPVQKDYERTTKGSIGSPFVPLP